MPAIHYNANGVHTFCGRNVVEVELGNAKLALTNTPERVTCRRCRKILLGKVKNSRWSDAGILAPEGQPKPGQMAWNGYTGMYEPVKK